MNDVTVNSTATFAWEGTLRNGARCPVKPVAIARL